jgi:hypothetical protein
MARFKTLVDHSHPAIPEDYIASFRGAEEQRRLTVYRLQKDLYDAALTLGQTPAQADDKIDTLFSTFASEWSIYILAGATAIVTAITDDITIPWLDTDVAGTTIRLRLTNRLSN